MANWDIREPCASCPYRKDSTEALWHRSEFEALLAHDADPMNGVTFGCHKYRNRPKSEWQFCAGWLLDQLERGLPSIRLRIACSDNHAAAERCFNALTDGGHELYSSVVEMCEANGVELEDARFKVDGEWRPNGDGG